MLQRRATLNFGKKEKGHGNRDPFVCCPVPTRRLNSQDAYAALADRNFRWATWKEFSRKFDKRLVLSTVSSVKNVNLECGFGLCISHVCGPAGRVLCGSGRK